jgi:queuine/archaeosine tRNA-ribosyltransferase
MTSLCVAPGALWSDSDRPMVWLGQSADTSSLCADFADLCSAPFLTSLGCAIRRPSLNKTHFHEGLREKLGVTGPLMIDSGGFALSTTNNIRWNIRNVSRAVRTIRADLFVSLDYPPHRDDTAAARRVKIRRSMRNFSSLASEFDIKILVPVIHGRTDAEVELSIELLESICARPRWVGIGGIVPLLLNRSLPIEGTSRIPELIIARTVKAVRKAFPESRIHVFGAGGTRTFPAVYAFGADSGDSIGWRQAAGFGSIFLPFRSQRVVKWKRNFPPPRRTLDSVDLEDLDNCICPICRLRPTIVRKLRALRSSFYYRAIHNAWVITNQWSYWPTSRAALAIGVASGSLGERWARAAIATL